MITSYFSPKNSTKSRHENKVNQNEDGNEEQQRKRPKISHLSPPLATKKAGLSGTSSKLTSSVARSPNPFQLGKRSVELCPEAKELLSYLNNDQQINPDISDGTSSNDHGKNWHQALLPLLEKNGMWFQNLARYVAKERQNQIIYPPPTETFSCLNLTPLEKLKVVIVGQDPYHGPNQGHGLCFSVRKGVQIPPSLRNIYKELLNDDVPFGPHGNKTTNINQSTLLPKHGFLERWTKQGVLLLNAVLTVRRGVANSHANKGWEQFTDLIIDILDREYSKKGKKGLVFLLWGKPASKKAERIIQRSRNGMSPHTVICTSHPSPLGASKTKSPFLGSKCFSRTNEALEKRGLSPIDWNVDGDL